MSSEESGFEPVVYACVEVSKTIVLSIKGNEVRVALIKPLYALIYTLKNSEDELLITVGSEAFKLCSKEIEKFLTEVSRELAKCRESGYNSNE